MSRIMAPYEKDMEVVVMGFTFEANVTAWFIQTDDGIEINSLDIGVIYMANATATEFLNVDKCIPPRMREQIDKSIGLKLQQVAWAQPLNWEVQDD